MNVTNNDRAEWAMGAVEAYEKLTRFQPDEPLEELIGDLLGDLMHLADREDLNFETLWRHAKSHYTVEVEEDE